MFSVSDLTKSYGLQIIFDKVTFTINDGERVGLVGRNGSGKTTLLRLLTGEEGPDSGSIIMPRNYTVGYLTQILSFSESTVLAEACLGLKKNEDGIDETYKVRNILLGLGFDEEQFFRHPTELSSGYQVRLNLAKVLVSQPSLLLLDEPTNYLDILSMRWLGQFLTQWRGELILITHDRAFMDSVVTHVIGIHRQGVRKIAGSTHKLYQQVLQEEEIYEKTRLNDEKKRKDLEQFINRFRAQASRASAVQSRIRALEKQGINSKLTEARSLDFEFPSIPFSGKWLMEVADLGFGYTADSILVRDLTFSVGKRDRIAIIGKNGKGKTTLLNLLAGEFAPTSGTVTRSANLVPGYFGQANIERLSQSNTVENEILQAHPDVSRGQARNVCGIMLFDGDKATKKISVLSGGEKSRVLLGKMLVRPANLLLLDEPTNHLDMESVDSLVEAIDAFDGAVILATHSEMILHAVAQRLIVFDGDSPWLFEGTYQDFLDRVGWQGEEMEARPAERAEDRKAQRGEKKELKRLRAEIINERSRALSPLEREMVRIERIITELEEKVEEENRSLLRASQVGEGKAIAALSISIHERQKQIEDLFGELDSVSRDHTERMREFETRLEELEQRKGPAEWYGAATVK
jgi:ATP-binding cassette, subfamily F, member 3